MDVFNLDCLKHASIPEITRRFGRPDPFDLDPNLEVSARIAGLVSFDRSILSLEATHVPGLHKLLFLLLKFFLRNLR